MKINKKTTNHLNRPCETYEKKKNASTFNSCYDRQFLCH